MILFLLRGSFPNISAEEVMTGPFSFNLFVSAFLLALFYHQRRVATVRNSELAASEERYRVVSELISDYAYSLEVAEDGTLLHEWVTDDSFKRATGYQHHELDSGQSVNLSLFYPEDEERLREELKLVLDNKPMNVEHRIRTKTGEERWVQIYRQPVWDEQQQRVTRFYGVTQDITARKRAELALKTNEERYRLLAETISDFVMLFDVSTGRTVYISPSYEKAMGYTLEELNRLRNADRVHPDDLATAAAAMRQVISGKPVAGVQYRSRTKQGDYLWVEVYSNPIRDDRGSVVQIIVSARDITERKQVEMALKASEERYRVVSELISDYAYFFRINPDGSRKREWITDSVARVTGYTSEEMPEQTDDLADIFYDGDLEAAREDFAMLLRGENLSREFQLRTKQGELRWLNITRRPVWNDDHTQVIGYYGSAKDITERKQAELALQGSEERYRVVSELTSDYAYFFRVNPDGTQNREWITESVVKVTGYTADEMPQDPESLAKIFYPDDLQKAVAELKLIKAGEIVNSESRLRTKAGDTRWLAISRQPIWDAEHTRIAGYYGVAKDITDRKTAELALRSSEQRYRKISELISDYAFYTRINTDGTMEREWITDSFFGVTGYLPEEVKATDSVKLFHPDSLEQLETDRLLVLRNESVNNEYRIITKQGAVRWLNLVRQPVWDNDQQRVIGYFGVARDITEHKQIEAQKLKLLLEQEQFSMISHLVEALSHDFRTSLATIETSRYLTERLMGDEARIKVQPKLDAIQRAVNHLATQLENLHMVSFLTVPSLVSYNLNYLISGVISDQSLKAKQMEIELIFKPDDSLPVLKIDHVKIEKAVRHLVVNALTHTPYNGSVTIFTQHTADHAFIGVQDSGKGIPEDTIHRIFEPFFRVDQARTVEKGGVGLGLTIVKMIVEAHGGLVNVESQMGKGSLFTIILPLKDDLAASA
ncbi:MAG: PAS domain S-box protein [Anaerolineae bacterium]|nr:PAS domain S-box protein [Anaerolineae bacterium]